MYVLAAPGDIVDIEQSHEPFSPRRMDAEARAFLICFVLSLVLIMTGVLDVGGLVLGVSDGFIGFAKSLESFIDVFDDPGIIDWLLFFVFGAVVIIGGICMLIVLIPLLILALIGQLGFIGSFIESLAHAFLFTCFLQVIIFPLCVIVIRPLVPALAVVINDVFIAVPETAAIQLRAGKEVTVRIRSKFDLFFAIVAGILLILSLLR